MQKQPLLILVIIFILGICFQEFFDLSSKVAVAFFVFAALSLLLLLTKNLLLLRFKNALYGIFALSFGIFLHQKNNKTISVPEFQGKQEIIFKLSKKLNSNEKNRRYEIVFWNRNISNSAVISIPKSFQELDFKHYFKAKAYINKVQPPANDYQFDYQKYLARKNIFYQIYLPEHYSLAERNDESLSEKVSQQRLQTLQKIDSSGLSGKSREFLKGIILADRTEMDVGTVSDFSKTGLAHILAISGSHIAIIFGLIYFLSLKIFPAKYRKHAIITSLLFIWAFAVFIGFGNSVVRACLMLSVYFIYVLLQRKPDFLHSMALAAAVILLIDTNQIFDVGFQLSFVAVFGIFWLNQPLLRYFPKPKSKLQNFMMNVLTVSLAAQIATLPLVLYYFHQFSFISIIANLVIIPLSEIVIVFSLLMVILIAFNLNVAYLETAFSFIIEKLLTLIHWFSGFDRLYFENIPLHLLELVIAFIAVYFLRFLIKNPGYKTALNFGFCVLVFFGLRTVLNYSANQKSEEMVHQFFKQKVFSAKENDHVTFWIKENHDPEKIHKYIVNPYLTSRRTKQVQIKIVPAQTKSITFKGKIFSIE